MALYTIADLHLTLGVGKEKSMEVFGRRWQGYTEKLEHNWRAIIEPEDDAVIPGDISWALGIDAALEDLRFIDSLPGTKYIGTTSGGAPAKSSRTSLPRTASQASASCTTALTKSRTTSSAARAAGSMTTTCPAFQREPTLTSWSTGRQSE